MIRIRSCSAVHTHTHTCIECHTKTMQRMFYFCLCKCIENHVNRQYGAEGFIASFFYCLGAVGFVCALQCLDKSINTQLVMTSTHSQVGFSKKQQKSVSQLGREKQALIPPIISLLIGMALIFTSYYMISSIVRIKIRGYLHN